MSPVCVCLPPDIPDYSGSKAQESFGQARGPDVVPNRLGASTVLAGNHQIAFSRHLIDGDDTKAKLLAHHGAGLIQPQGRECLPHAEFPAWHRAEVFKEPARE